MSGVSRSDTAYAKGSHTGLKQFTSSTYKAMNSPMTISVTLGHTAAIRPAKRPRPRRPSVLEASAGPDSKRHPWSSTASCGGGPTDPNDPRPPTGTTSATARVRLRPRHPTSPWLSCSVSLITFACVRVCVCVCVSVCLLFVYVRFRPTCVLPSSHDDLKSSSSKECRLVSTSFSLVPSATAPSTRTRQPEFYRNAARSHREPKQQITASFTPFSDFVDRTCGRLESESSNL